MRATTAPVSSLNWLFARKITYHVLRHMNSQHAAHAGLSPCVVNLRMSKLAGLGSRVVRGTHFCCDGGGAMTRTFTSSCFSTEFNTRRKSRPSDESASHTCAAGFQALWLAAGQ